MERRCLRSSGAAAVAPAPDCFWREWEFWVLALATLLLYGARLTALPIRGEETRRAQVACEMVRTGDWIVPRQQGTPLLSRPPLGSYPIAIAAILLGDCSLLAVRLPTLLATWLTVLLIYSYGRLFLSRLGALAAGLAYGTMGQVLVLGRLAETEATFTFLLSGALLAWHWGYCRGGSGRWGRLWPWLAGYGLAALATLAKGPQAPVYFAAPVFLFLAWRRDWRTLLSRSHLAGLALFAAIGRCVADSVLDANGLAGGEDDLARRRRDALRRRAMANDRSASARLSRGDRRLHASLVAAVDRLFGQRISTIARRRKTVCCLPGHRDRPGVFHMLGCAGSEGAVFHAALSLPRAIDRIERAACGRAGSGGVATARLASFSDHQGGAGAGCGIGRRRGRLGPAASNGFKGSSGISRVGSSRSTSSAH